MKKVAGPLLASAALSCSSPPAEPIAPILAVEGPDRAPGTATVDPVDYDPAAETDRLARTEALLAARDDARDERVEAHEDTLQRRADARARARALAIRRHTYIACGRG